MIQRLCGKKYGFIKCLNRIEFVQNKIKKNKNYDQNIKFVRFECEA